jgi:1,4-dihydroxy-6-naphthoate synthase
MSKAMRTELTLAQTPTADSAFMLCALATGRIDTGDLEFEHQLGDIEALNLRVLNSEVDVSAVSIHAYAKVSDDYLLLPHGLTAGERHGPRIVARESLEPGDIKGRVVAVPGQLTSAHLVLRLFEPNVEVRFVRFDEVMDYVADGFADAGVVVHEGQLTYPEAGLSLVLDLGEWWHEQTGLPLPLRGNVSRRALGGETIGRISRYMQRSILYALEHRREALDYALQFAGELSRAQVDRFVGTYVNSRTLDIDDDGREAVLEFLERGYRARFLDRLPQLEIFEY